MVHYIQNNGILVIYDSNDAMLEVLSDFNVTNRDKLSLLLDSSMLDQDEKSNANVCSEFINGRITVRRGTASLYMSMMERLEQVFKAHNLEERIFSSVKYSIQVKNSGKRISYIAKPQVENENYEKEMSEISQALYESIRNNFKEFLSSKEINGYPDSLFRTNSKRTRSMQCNPYHSFLWSQRGFARNQWSSYR